MLHRDPHSSASCEMRRLCLIHLLALALPIDQDAGQIVAARIVPTK